VEGKGEGRSVLARTMVLEKSKQIEDSDVVLGKGGMPLSKGSRETTKVRGVESRKSLKGKKRDRVKKSEFS